jgi:hypothetical protein
MSEELGLLTGPWHHVLNFNFPALAASVCNCYLLTTLLPVLACRPLNCQWCWAPAGPLLSVTVPVALWPRQAVASTLWLPALLSLFHIA